MSDLKAGYDGNLALGLDGQPMLDGTLETAVYLSLFGPEEWWGNAYGTLEERVSSKFEGLMNQGLTNQTRLDAEVYARDALGWLLDVGSQALDVTAEIPASSFLTLLVEVTGPSGDLVSLRYGINWENQKIEVNP